MALPIDTILCELRNTLASQSRVVLSAAPGAGKTTRIPLALRNEPWLAGKKIIMLEPRRIAARAAACYMANLLNEEPGATVGYRVRLDTRVSNRTKIEVITEGILTRMLQSDPALEGVGLVIFDEFHERNLHSDLGLALCLQAQMLIRPDLKILVMSATLDTAAVASLLQAPVLVSEGRQFPVETYYQPSPLPNHREQAVVQAILHALRQHSGDILVFLPGTREINRVARMLADHNLEAIAVVPLHGNLPLAVQDKALTPSLQGWRKVVLSTSIAETSLTVEGIRIVIDSGLMRVPRFSVRTGMTRLETVAVSQAAAAQRLGRAGRLGPGVCYRLWSLRDQAGLEKFSKPEIVTADLTSLILELAAWGVTEPQELCWLDLPPSAAVEQAKEVLVELEAITPAGMITAHGRQLANLALHPRLAHMLVRAIELGHGKLASELAALLSERDILTASRSVDLRLRLDLLHIRSQDIEPTVRKRLQTEIAFLCKYLSIGEEQSSTELCGMLLGLAYPDRIGQNRGDGRFLLANGRGTILSQEQALAESSWIVAVEVEDSNENGRILLATPIEPGQIVTIAGNRITSSREVYWDNTAQAVKARQRERLGALLLKETPISPEPVECLRALLQGIAQTDLEILPWTKQTRQWRQRVEFLHYWQSDEWPDVSDEALLVSLENWLGPYSHGISSIQELKQLNMLQILEGGLSWSQLRQLDQEAPTHMLVPSGQRIPIDYTNPTAPILSVRLQELFGMTDTPRVAGGKVALTIALLSPARRPVQVTQDLANFWRTTYFEVRKELLGRYPKHYWPEDPMNAQATHRTKARM